MRPRTISGSRGRPMQLTITDIGCISYRSFRDIYIYVCICICIYTHVYIYSIYSFFYVQSDVKRDKGEEKRNRLCACSRDEMKERKGRERGGRAVLLQREEG